MFIKVYVSGISGNKIVKKRQEHIFLVLNSKNIKYEVIDITEPGNEFQKEFMQIKSKSKGSTALEPKPRHALPPQIFNEEVYCGDYEAFASANEENELEEFLKLKTIDRMLDANSKVEPENGLIIEKSKSFEEIRKSKHLTTKITDNEPDDTIFQLVKRNVTNCDPEGQIPGSVCGKSIPWSPRE